MSTREVEDESSLTEAAEETNVSIQFLRSVGGKLTLLVCAIILLTAAVASVIDYTYVRKYILDEIHKDLEIYVESLSSVLLRNQRNEESLIEFVVQRSDLMDLLAEHRDGSIDASRIQDTLKLMLAGTYVSIVGFDQIRLLDTQGIVVAATDDSQINRDLSADGLFTKGRNELAATFTSREDAGFDMAFSVPIRDGEGALLGVAIVDFRDESLREVVEDFGSQHESSRVRIGVLNAAGDLHYIFMSADSNVLVDALPMTDPPLMLALQGATGFMDDVRDYRGVKVVSAYRPVGYGGLGLVAQVDAAEIYEPLNNVLFAIGAFGVFFTAVSVLLAIIVVNRSTNPLLQLVEATQRVTRGDYSMRINTHRRDEIGLLSDAFDEMSVTVEKNTLHLEESVRERTKELEISQNQLTAMVKRLEVQAEILDRDLTRAEVIQRSLLPRQPPSIPGLTLSSLYIPCQHVGGDLYDVVRIDDRHIGLVIADATGHGVSAAMLSVLFKNRLDVIEKEDQVYNTTTPNQINEALGIPITRRSAVSVFDKVNRELIEHVRAENMFVTAMFCILDVNSKELSVTNAGHPPLIVFRASGETEFVNADGPALGLYEDAQYNEQLINLEYGDRVFMYTDGLFDLPGMEQRTLKDITSEVHSYSSDVDILEEVLSLAAGDVERPDRDDVTLLMLDMRDGESSFDERYEILTTDAAEMVEDVQRESSIALAENGSNSFLIFAGKVTWLQGLPVIDAVRSVLRNGRDLIVDLSNCDSMDSAMMGTLHEITDLTNKANKQLVIQGIVTSVRQSFIELGMHDVLEHVSGVYHAPPKDRRVLSNGDFDVGSQQRWLLHAHEVLANLNQANQEEFSDVIDMLRKELQQSTTSSSSQVT